MMNDAVLRRSHWTQGRKKHCSLVASLSFIMPKMRLSHIRALLNPVSRRTKIVCTLGPSCWSINGLLDLIDAGMNVARFNFSHGDKSSHSFCLQQLRSALSRRPGRRVAIMLDTKGPEIRTGTVDASLNGKLTLQRGNQVEVGTDYSRPCSPNYLACSYASLPNSLSVGSKILVADGLLSLEVTEIRTASVMAKVLNTASFGDKKNMSLPGAIVDLPVLTQKDIEDLQHWGIEHDIDFVAASFVRKPEDIDVIRNVLGERGKSIQIISKIENQEGLDNFDAILEKTDGVMVARGDLGMELPLERVFIAQKLMTAKCNLAGKPVVTATQMLESMLHNPQPTRAECSDIANAVLDGTDALMLSGETANGDYPIKAVDMMRNTCIAAESTEDVVYRFDTIVNDTRKLEKPLQPAEAVAASAVRVAIDVNAAAIVIVTLDGEAARQVAKYRPGMPICVATPSAKTARQLEGFTHACEGHLVDASCSASAAVASALEHLRESRELLAGQRVVVVRGSDDHCASDIAMIHVHVLD